IIPKKKKNVAGKIVLITGAGSGLGRLSAITFASLGAILVLWDINEEGNMETCRMIKEKGDVKVFAYTCNCGHRQDVYRFADQQKKYHSDNITFCCFHSRDPLLLPILEQEYVAPKVLNAILEEQVYWIINAILEEQNNISRHDDHPCRNIGMDTSVASLTGQEKTGEVQTENERKHL
ncbi:hypothetical protein EI555_012657, partial [Monodon monoceros]